jgi:adenylate cyclase
MNRAAMRMPIPHYGNLTQKLTLVSGLILFAFAAAHFLNHAVGLLDVEAMYQVQQWRLALTRSWLGSLVLGTALLTHIVLALCKLARRATLRLPAWELVQIGFGLAIPFLLLPHIVDTRVARALFGVRDNYLYELARLWPSGAAAQSALLLLVWHGCLGIHYWLRLNRHYRLLQPALLIIAVIIPAAALAGFVVSGRAVTSLMAEEAMAARIKDLTHWPIPEDEHLLAAYRLTVRLIFVVLILIAAGYMVVRHLAMLAAPKILISYVGGPSVRTAIGPTLLEISRANGIAHAAACGGRARCTTCLVRIEEGAQALKPPKSAEAAMLASIDVPKGTRLGCQIRPRAALTVTRLVGAPTTAEEEVTDEEPEAAGVERQLAVLSVAMNNSVELMDGRLPYDVVFILNEFLAGIGAAITTHEGRIDKLLADSVLAIFGERAGLEAGCRQALRAARAIDLAIDRLNEKVAAEIGRPVEGAIGIHAGKVVIGRIGYGKATELTAVGTVIETAVGFRSFAQKSGHQVILSAEVARAAGLPDAGGAKIKTMTLRAREREGAGTIHVFAIARGKDLPADTPA